MRYARRGVTAAVAAAAVAGVCLGSAACGGARSVIPCRPHIVQTAGAKVFRASSRHRDPEVARRRARLEAEAEALRTLGVQVDSVVEEESIFEDGRDRERVVIRSTERVCRTELRGVRGAYCADPDGATMRAAVVIPKTEWARLQREVRRATLLVVACSTEPASACPPGIDAEIADVAVRLGLEVVARLPASEVSADGRNGHDVARLGRQHHVARVLWVELGSEFRDRHEGVLYAYGSASARLLETTDGETLQSLDQRDIKAGVYEHLPHRRSSPVDAAREALEAALDALRKELSYWRFGGCGASAKTSREATARPPRPSPRPAP